MIIGAGQAAPDRTRLDGGQKTSTTGLARAMSATMILHTGHVLPWQNESEYVNTIDSSTPRRVQPQACRSSQWSSLVGIYVRGVKARKFCVSDRCRWEAELETVNNLRPGEYQISQPASSEW